LVKLVHVLAGILNVLELLVLGDALAFRTETNGTGEEIEVVLFILLFCLDLAKVIDYLCNITVISLACKLKDFIYVL